MNDKRNWIMFARQSSRDNCIGKARFVDCHYDVTEETLTMEIKMNGKVYTGVLQPVNEEEE